MSELNCVDMSRWGGDLTADEAAASFFHGSSPKQPAGSICRLSSFDSSVSICGCTSEKRVGRT